MRGVGGFFFDHFNTTDIDSDLSFIKDISGHFINSYFPLVEKEKMKNGLQLMKTSSFTEEGAMLSLTFFTIEDNVWF